jgi:glutamyl-tRNA synthetase/glutamyl-Q tRNA(Asp) synthetase
VPWRALAASLPPRWTTRFAPAPTGRLHLGHVLNAVYVWGVARAFGGRVVLRIEDHDRARCRPEYETALIDDLAWLGFEPDAVAPPQRDRGARYGQALAALHSAGLAYPCDCSRRTIAGDAADVPNEEIRYDGRCRERRLDPAGILARRVRMDEGEESFTDALLGPQHASPAQQCGDLLVRDRLGQWTYQYAVTVDDLDQSVDLVIRGEDLLGSTARQLRLARLLGRATPPRFLHHPLLRHPDGAKLSKSRGDSGIAELRASGRTAAEVIGLAAWRGGILADVRAIPANETALLFRA